VDNIGQRLEGIGLTPGEVRVYLALLDLGISTTGPIVDSSRISSSKVYNILDRLVKKGMVSFVTKTNVKHFEALEPKKILEYLSLKERKLQDQRSIVKELIPTLSARRKRRQEQEASRVFLGYQGIKSYFTEVCDNLEKGETRLVLGAQTGYSNHPPVVRFFQMMNRKFVAKGIRTKIIFNKDLRRDIDKRYKSLEKTQVRYLDHVTPASIGIQGDNVDILVWTEEKAVLFAITSKEVAESYRSFFLTLWKMAAP